jgi:hypothetical protein
MKSSRAMLLAAMLFAVPAFANETAKVEGQVEQTTNEPTKVDPTSATDSKVEEKKEETKEEPKKAEDSKEADAPKKDEAKADEKSMFAKARELAVAPFVFALATAPDYIAKKTLGNVAAMECLKDGNIAAFLGNKWTGRATVAGTAALITYLVWNATQSEDVDADDSEMIFTE